MRSGHDFVLTLYQLLYERVVRPLLFTSSPETRHAQMLRMLSWLDQHPVFLSSLARLAKEHDGNPFEVGGVRLPHPFIVAAGLVKGYGFASDDTACQAVADGSNLIPGWRAVPALLGAVEFGSFTGCPRVGNAGHTLWRDADAKSLQNRVGLKNPGTIAAAGFLSSRRDELPPVFGINVAVTPGIDDVQQEAAEIREAITAFLRQDVIPSWFTLNLSCPNTEDDTASRQTQAYAHTLCQASMHALQETGVPLWVKVSPSLAPVQYERLMQVFEKIGIRAVIATNTLPAPTPANPAVWAGLSGQRLYSHALATVQLLCEIRERESYAIDVIGCGGILDGQSYSAYARLGVKAVQYWSALVYRGPLAAALIAREAQTYLEGKGYESA